MTEADARALLTGPCRSHLSAELRRWLAAAPWQAQSKGWLVTAGPDERAFLLSPAASRPGSLAVRPRWGEAMAAEDLVYVDPAPPEPSAIPPAPSIFTMVKPPNPFAPQLDLFGVRAA